MRLAGSPTAYTCPLFLLLDLSALPPGSSISALCGLRIVGLLVTPSPLWFVYHIRGIWLPLPPPLLLIVVIDGCLGCQKRIYSGVRLLRQVLCVSPPLGSLREESARRSGFSSCRNVLCYNGLLYSRHNFPSQRFFDGIVRRRS